MKVSKVNVSGSLAPDAFSDSAVVLSHVTKVSTVKVLVGLESAFSPTPEPLSGTVSVGELAAGADVTEADEVRETVELEPSPILKSMQDSYV